MYKTINGNHAHPSKTSMYELYQRLQQVGFNRTFVQQYLLPDWWDDKLGDNPTMRAIAEVGIARMIGVPIQALHTSGTPLHLVPNYEFRLKHNKGVTVPELLPAIALAQSVAHILAATLDDLPSLTTGYHALTIRREILAYSSTVDLAGLLEWAWTHGIIVVHLCQLPRHTKRFSGMALLCDNRPVIVLASLHVSPPWLAFHLAHELGHIILGHIKSDHPLLDVDIDRQPHLQDFSENALFEEMESEANQFAIRLLTGRAELSFEPEYGLTAEKLVKRVRQLQEKSQIDAGTLALVYGRTANRMGVAQSALGLLQLAEGGHQLIVNAMQQRLPADLPESVAAFLPLMNGAE